jgi:hypothetical protein
MGKNTSTLNMSSAIRKGYLRQIQSRKGKVFRNGSLFASREVLGSPFMKFITYVFGGSLYLLNFYSDTIVKGS